MKAHFKIFLTGITMIVSLSGLFREPIYAQLPQREEIIVIAPYEPTLPEVFKINLQPKIEAEEVKLPPVVIGIIPQKMNVQHTIEPVQEANPPAETPSVIYRNHIRAGLGNYATPYLELNAGSLRNSDYLLNVQLRHYSSLGKIKDYGHSSFSDNLARISAKRFFEHLTLGAEARFEHDVLHHYGFLKAEFPDTIYNTSRDDIRQRFNQAGLGFTLNSNNKEKEGIHYDAGVAYGMIADVFETSEHRYKVDADVKSSFRILSSDDKQSLGIKMEVAGFTTTDSIQKWNNTLVQAHPYFRFKYQEYELLAGFRMAFDSDTSLHFRFYPVAEGRLQLLKNRLAVFVGIDGETEKNSFYSLASENPFIHSVLHYRNTSNKLRFYGGLQGSIGKRIDFTMSGSNTIAGNMPLFVNDTLAPFNRFNVIYDDLNLVRGNLSLSYSISQQLRIASGFEIFHYSPDREEKAWHKPAFKAHLEGWFNCSDKLAFRAGTHVWGKSWARIRNSETGMFETSELKPWIDLSLGATYRFNNQLHFFLDARNLTAQRHFYWYNYPSQRLHVMAGAGYSF